MLLVILKSLSYCFCVVSASSVLVEGSMMSTHLLVTHVGRCETSSPPLIVTVKEFKVTSQNYDSILSGEFNVTEDIEDGWNVKATMQKCQDIRNIDTCDHFRTFWVVRAGCSREEPIYATLVQYTEPRVACPVRSGSYQLRDYPVSTADASLTAHEAKISTSVFGYRLILEGSTVHRTKLLCVEAYLQLLYPSDRNWLKQKNQAPAATPTNTTPKYDDVEEK